MLRMVSHPHRPQSGHITCYLNRTYHVLPTKNQKAVDMFPRMPQYSARGCSEGEFEPHVGANGSLRPQFAPLPAFCRHYLSLPSIERSNSACESNRSAGEEA